MRKLKGHLERDVLDHVRERRLEEEFWARRRVATEFGLLPKWIISAPSRSARHQTAIGVSGRVRMILAALGLALTLFLLFFMNQGIIPEKIVINKQINEMVIVNHTSIREVIIKSEPELIVLEKEIPIMDHRGNIWCNGEGMCYQL